MKLSVYHHSKKDIRLQICIGRVIDELNEYIAHCRELDLISLGSTTVDTFTTMLETIDVQLDVCAKNNNDEPVPEYYCSGEEFWLIWHATASKIKSIEIEDLTTKWIILHTDLNSRISVLENHSEVVDKVVSLDECYNIFKVLKYINGQLDSRYRLRLLPVHSNKNYYSLQGKGYSDAIESYPLPVFQLYNLSAHHISRIIKRFCLQSIDISESHLIES